jgi:hypothetical protein
MKGNKIIYSTINRSHIHKQLRTRNKRKKKRHADVRNKTQRKNLWANLYSTLLIKPQLACNVQHYEPHNKIV